MSSNVHKDIALEALRENTDRIIESSIDHELLASVLYSKKLIDRHFFKNIMDPKTNEANDTRLSRLTKYVRQNIEGNRNYFEQFLTAIEKMSSKGLMIALELKKSYNALLRSKQENAKISASVADDAQYFDLPLDGKWPPQSERDVKNFITSTIAECEFFEEHPPQDVSLSPDKEMPKPSRNEKTKASDLFERHYDSITIILSENKIEIPFATKLCEVGLIGLAERDEAIKIEFDSIMRSKVIVGAVSTMIRKGVRPDNLMNRFVRVITLEEFNPYFKDIIKALQKEGYKSEVFKSINHQSKSQTSTHLVDETIEKSSGNGDSISRQTTSEWSDEGYRKHLIRQHKLSNPRPFNPGKEWKYFDLISTEESVTKGNKSPGCIDLHRLPQNVEDPPRSLIIGPPGIGKSSLAIELCKRWSRKELLHKYEYVILLEVRNPKINLAKNLDQVIPNKEWRDKIETTNGRDCLFIIEGYDELAPDNKEFGFVTQLIKAESLSEASLIVTSRPTYRDELSSYFDAKEIIEIIGFSSSTKDEYIEHILKQNAGRFQNEISKFPIMDEYSSIPFYLAILVHLFAGYKQTCNPTLAERFPNTLTKMYGALICELILRFVEQHPSRFPPKLIPETIHLPPGEFQYLPLELYINFFKLCRLSYIALMNPTYALQAYDQESFDLVNEHTESIEGRSKYFSFRHSSIKEYLGAYYISRMKPELINNHWLNMIKFKRFNLALQFLSGFHPCTLKDLFVIPHNDFNNFYTFRHLCEFDSNEVIITAFEKVNKSCVSRTWPASSPGDFWCLGRIIALSACDWELGFTFRHLQNCHLQMLQNALRHYNQEQSKSSIIKLSLSLNRFDEKGLHFLFQISPNILSKTYHINLSGNHLKNETIQLLTQHINLFPQLKELLIHNNDIGCHQPLIEALMKHKHNITKVSFSNLASSECEMLMTKMNENLKIIELWQLSSESVKTTIELIPHEKSGSKLNKLEFHQSQVTRESIENLSKTLPRSRITEFAMKNCNITSSTFPEIVMAAAKLCHLDLSDNRIDLSYARALESLRAAHSKAKLIYEHNSQHSQVNHGHQNITHGQHALEQSHDQFGRAPYQQQYDRHQSQSYRSQQRGRRRPSHQLFEQSRK